MVDPKTARYRRHLATFFSVLVLTLLVAIAFFPELFARLSTWLNLYDSRNQGLLDWARAFNLLIIVMAAVNLAKVMWKYPTRRRFYLMFLPLLCGIIYFTAQFVYNGPVYPRNGLIVANIISGLISAGYYVSLGLVKSANLERWR